MQCKKDNKIRQKEATAIVSPQAKFIRDIMNFRSFNHSDYGDIRVTFASGSVPLFVARDITTALGFSNLSNPIGKYCKHAVLSNELEEKVKCMRLIPESDVYRLVLRSRRKSAMEFQDWICEEVLPKLRGTSLVLSEGGRQEQVRNIITPEEEAEEILEFSNLGSKAERRISELEKKMATIIEQIGIFEDIDKNYSTLPGYIQRHGLPILVSDYARLGSRISEICKRRNIKVSKITDVRGSLNLYPNYVLHELFKDYLK